MYRNSSFAAWSSVLFMLLFAPSELFCAETRTNVVTYCYTDSVGDDHCSTDLSTVEIAMRADHILGDKLERCPEADTRTGRITLFAKLQKYWMGSGKRCWGH
jgi:hypothetical protein